MLTRFLNLKTPPPIHSGGRLLKELALTMKIKFLFGLLVVSTLAGCSSQQTIQHTTAPTSQSLTNNQFAANLSTLSAEFTTRIYGDGNDTKTQWHLWRSPERVEWLNIFANTSEIWTKTSQDLWFYSKAFHTDKQVIEYSPVDLNLLQVAPAWQSFAAAIDPALLQKLSKTKKINPLDGFQRIQYRGTLDNAAYEVDWLPELSLATRVKIVEAGVTRLTEVRRPLVISDNTKTPQNISRYRVIEYSDLGDMERDPFVMKIQHSLFSTHEHAH